MGQQLPNLMRDSVYHWLRQDILQCRIRPGADIREPELSERFNVSRSPVRDALLRLEADGLVVVHARKGYQAAPISMADAKDLFELRSLLEAACAVNAAEHATDAELRDLDRYRRLDDLGSAESQASFIGYNRDFHLAITGLSRNRRLRQTVREIIEEFDRLVHVSVEETHSEERARLVAEHCAIIDALQQREGKQTARLLTAHVERARKRVIGALSRAAIQP